VVPEGETSRDHSNGDFAGVRAEALQVAQDALQWRLTQTRWPSVEQALIAMDAALVSEDPEALAAATADLEMAGPMRITKIGAAPIDPPPPVRDRLNRLVHSLGVAQRPQSKDTQLDDDGSSPLRPSDRGK
jgi:hypothetical protein